MNIKHIHVLAIPHTITHRNVSCCAFTQKVLKFCKMMKVYTNNIIYHYGHEDSEVMCDEHITVVTREEHEKCYGNHDWKKDYFKYDMNDDTNKIFTQKCIEEVGKRCKRGHFILCFWGHGHKKVADAFPDAIVVEPGIGNFSCFSNFRVFESYACMHVNYGKHKIERNSWYDAVIPNYFDLVDFDYSEEKGDYLLFLGRTINNKGIHLAIDLAMRTDHRLIIAGQGQISSDNPNIIFLGPVGPDSRKKLLSKAKCLIAPTFYLEPFGGSVVEALLSGTPVITSDWGAFTETNPHGLTGYRCRTVDHFIWAINNINKISPKRCREWAENNYSLEKVAKMFEEYFDMASKLWDDKGFYLLNPKREELDWLKKDIR